MNKTKNITSISVVTAFSILLGFSAGADEKKQDHTYYVGAAYAAPLYTRSDLDNGAPFRGNSLNFDLSVGKKILPYYRLEFSTGYRKFSQKFALDTDFSYSSSFSLQKFMVNNYVDFPQINNHFIPYIVGGVGVAHINFGKFQEIYNGNSSDIAVPRATNRFAYQFGAGINVDVTERISLDLSTIYFNPGIVKFKDAAHSNVKFNDIEILIGLRYNF